MDTSNRSGSRTGHAHSGGRRHSRDVPVMVAASVLAGAAILAIAALYTNSPAGRANAAPVNEPLVPGTTEYGALTPQNPLQPLRFDAELDEGPLALGQAGHVVVTVHNDNDVPIRLESTSVEVTQTSDPRCQPAWLRFATYEPRRARVVTIDPAGSASLTLGYTLQDLAKVNQDACKGARFTLAITGQGRPV